MPTHLRLALLVSDHPTSIVRERHGVLRDFFFRLLTSSLARVSPDTTFTLDAYDVVNEMAYPFDDDDYDGLLITGSRASAYQDIEWINKLVAYVKRIIIQKPTLKIFGICFGHQIIARALGGACVPNELGWEVAVTTIQLTPIGKAIFGADELDLQQMHRDHVPMAPPNAHVLGSTANTPNHGMVIFDPLMTPKADDLNTDAPQIPLTSIQVLTVQGHPEFTPSIMATLLDTRVGMLGEERVKDGHLREAGVPGHHHPHGLACDGVGRVGRVIWGVLGVA